MATSMKTTMTNITSITPGACEWCGAECDPVNACCSLLCEANLRRAEATQGLAVIRTLKEWRMGDRKTARRQGMLETIVPVVDRFLVGDRKRREHYGHQRRVKESQKAQEADGEPTPAEDPDSTAPASPDEAPDTKET